MRRDEFGVARQGQVHALQEQVLGDDGDGDGGARDLESLGVVDGAKDEDLALGVTVCWTSLAMQRREIGRTARKIPFIPSNAC